MARRSQLPPDSAFPLQRTDQLDRHSSHVLARVVSRSRDALVVAWYESSPAIACVEHWRRIAGEWWEHWKTENIASKKGK